MSSVGIFRGERQLLVCNGRAIGAEGHMPEVDRVLETRGVDAKLRARQALSPKRLRHESY